MKNVSRLKVSKKHTYAVNTSRQAKAIALNHVKTWLMPDEVGLGLAELDDRYHVWRVPLTFSKSHLRVGELVVDAKTSLVQVKKSSSKEVVLSKLSEQKPSPRKHKSQGAIVFPPLCNSIIFGDSIQTLPKLPAESIGLAFTSPPYFNARPEYSDYVGYEEYLLTIRQVIQQVHRVLAEGRFFVMNTSPVLLRRASRSQASRRIAVPFDLHRIFIEEGFEFVDDIIWEKPSGAGWATGRGRRFAADRNPLQYKAVPVTEYVMVYRKQTDRLLDWNIRNHPDQEAVERSRIGDDYERTNIWKISPSHRKDHPAVFPSALAERVIRYYSFEGDVVLDPFAGSGTTGRVAAQLGRGFVMCEMDHDFVNLMRSEAIDWLGIDGASEIQCVNCQPIAFTTASAVQEGWPSP